MSKIQMQYRPLGRCGTKVSILGLGGWTTYGSSVKDEKMIQDILHAAYEAGVNFFDIADVYAHGDAERMMGQVLKEFPRHTLVISSKGYFPASEEINDRGLSRKHIMESIEKSLKRIGTDYLDIYFCHRFDMETPIEETARAMDDLIHQGKILYWGTSEWSGAQLKAVNELCEKKNFYPPQVEQPQYSLLERKKFEKEVQSTIQELGMGVVVWSPLASGLLTGKYDEGVPKNSRLSQIDWLREAVLSEHRIKKVKQMKKLSDELGCTRAQLALAWVASQTGISSVITGATRLEQLKENLGALKVLINDKIQGDLDKIFL
jgi:voltage-dependent potassium channel beta subunit